MKPPRIHHDSSALETPVVSLQRFLSATRESGYRTVASAVAELVDNAIEARATTIEILIDEADAGGGMAVAVLDDGTGISPIRMRSALQFGGTHRFNSREGLGRFGMGLPNASLSYARRVDVYSWKQSGLVRSASLDLDRILAGADRGIRNATVTRLPPWLATYREAYSTAIVWSRCDRLPTGSVSSIYRLIRTELGRIFRHALRRDITLMVGGHQVEVLDPVRLTPAPDDSPIGLLPLLSIPFSASTGKVSLIEVQFVTLPIEQWSGLPNLIKRRYRITKASGVSVLRAGREIAYGWHFLGGKRRENYDDWWRCEVRFAPDLDEHFGVTHTKQGIRPTKALVDALGPTISAQARRLNAEARSRFEGLKSRFHAAEMRAESRDAFLPPVDSRRRSKATKSRSIAAAGVRYRLKAEESPGRAFIRTVRRHNDVSVYLNQLHPFYTRLYAPTAGSAQDVAIALDAFILAIGRAASGGAPGYDEFIERISDLSAVFMEPK